MADGLNQARAMRVAEIIGDFRNLQHYLSTIQASPAPGEHDLEGYKILRACIADGRAILASDYSPVSVSPANGGDETAKKHLQMIILDAATRRFRSQRACMRAVIAQRWAAARTQVLQGQTAQSGNGTQLLQLDVQLQSDLMSITDELVMETLYNGDATQGKYLDEDPSLQDILVHLENTQ